MQTVPYLTACRHKSHKPIAEEESEMQNIAYIIELRPLCHYGSSVVASFPKVVGLIPAWDLDYFTLIKSSEGIGQYILGYFQ